MRKLLILGLSGEIFHISKAQKRYYSSDFMNNQVVISRLAEWVGAFIFNYNQIFLTTHTKF